jgi:hypothetical protein
MKKRFLFPLLTVGALSALYAIGAPKVQGDSRLHAQRCIELKGDTSRCDQVVKTWLEPDMLAKYNTALEQRKKRQEANEAKRQKEIAAAHARADQAKLKAAEEIAKADAKFKAEGWWEASNGVYVRWCTDANPCPGSASDHYTAKVWRAMVWCKERACGDIYARMNISSGGAVIGWTNDTAYGDYGQKVVLTFGSHLSGKGQIVEFNARG